MGESNSLGICDKTINACARGEYPNRHLVGAACPNHNHAVFCPHHCISGVVGIPIVASDSGRGNDYVLIFRATYLEKATSNVDLNSDDGLRPQRLNDPVAP